MEYAPWTGYDLDETIAKKSKYRGLIGEAIPSMIERIQKDLDAGKRVKIFTARVVHGSKEIKKIKRWLLAQGLPQLEVTNEKDPGMQKLYDDKAQRVEKNTGKLI